jgi:threonine/homoserine/homoserine lactone efflux protein
LREVHVIDHAALPAYLATVLVITLAPGPDNAYIVAVAVALGSRAGVLSAAGMAVGMAVHVTAATLGLALLLRTIPAAVTGVRLAGAVYLGWLAVSTLRSARDSGITAPLAPPDRQVLGRALLTNLTNPKIILFFAAFLPQFTRAGFGPIWAQLLILGVVFLVIGLAWDSIVGLFAARLGTRLARGTRAATRLNVLAGLTFGALALALLGDALFTR